jgi:DNA gyrase subunit B
MSTYTSSDITVLRGLEAVRKRPGMYIGSTDRAGVEHLLHEILDNAIDEHIAGHCNKIELYLEKDGTVEIRDNGRGIPVDSKQYGVSALQILMTTLHSGGKFGKGAYSISGGLNGVGISIVNALSKATVVTVMRDGYIWQQDYSRGAPKSKLRKLGKSDKTGSTVKYLPDDEIFTDISLDMEKILPKLNELAYLNKGLTLTISYYEDDTKKELCFAHKEGLSGYLKEFAGVGRHAIAPIVVFAGDADYKRGGSDNNIKYDLVFQWFEDYKPYSFHSFVNNIKTTEGGTHEEAFKNALNNALISYAKDNNLLHNNDTTPNWDDIKEGLAGAVSVLIAEPLFEGQTKTKLRDNDLRSTLYKIIKDHIAFFFENNHKLAKAIIAKIVRAANTRAALYRTRDLLRKKNLSASIQLPGKLAECSSNKFELRELFIVEGNSAGGSAKNGRDPEVQAILPIRGKILNIEKKSIHSILKNTEIQSIILALGTGIDKAFDYTKLRYNKIILMADADVDGQHIKLLLLTLLFRLMPELIYRGHVYTANPPLYKLIYKNYAEYCLTANELRERTKVLKSRFKSFNDKDIMIQRFKGLGEMDAEELFETCMSSDNRILTLCKTDDAEATSNIIDALMGNDSEKRRNFINEHGKSVDLLDI